MKLVLRREYSRPHVCIPLPYHPTPDVKQFVSCRRYETFSLHHLLQGFSTTACDWLGPSNHKATRVSESDMRKRRELLEEFVFWYFDGFLVPLLKVRIWVMGEADE